MKTQNTIRYVVEIVLVSILGWNLYFIGAWSVVNIGITLALAWIVWMGMSTSRLRVLKWFSLIGAGLTVTGLSGMSLAMRAYPDSNMLGG